MMLHPITLPIVKAGYHPSYPTSFQVAVPKNSGISENTAAAGGDKINAALAPLSALVAVVAFDMPASSQLFHDGS
jgi:hypothetical protein